MVGLQVLCCGPGSLIAVQRKGEMLTAWSFSARRWQGTPAPLALGSLSLHAVPSRPSSPAHFSALWLTGVTLFPQRHGFSPALSKPAPGTWPFTGVARPWYLPAEFIMPALNGRRWARDASPCAHRATQPGGAHDVCNHGKAITRQARSCMRAGQARPGQHAREQARAERSMLGMHALYSAPDGPDGARGEPQCTPAPPHARAMGCHGAGFEPDAAVFATCMPPAHRPLPAPAPHSAPHLPLHICHFIGPASSPAPHLRRPGGCPPPGSLADGRCCRRCAVRRTPPPASSTFRTRRAACSSLSWRATRAPACHTPSSLAFCNFAILIPDQSLPLAA